jgi:phosphatidylglycerophosphatase A
VNWRTPLVTVGGLGFFRPFPGTWGSMPAAGAAWVLLLFRAPDLVYHGAMAAITLCFSLVCVALGPWAEAKFGRKDASPIVADEMAGQALTLALLSDVALRPGWTWPWQTGAVAAGFVLFRIFDILKPPPAQQIQRVRGGWGVLLDDIFAGLYALGALHAILYFVGP